MTDASPNGGRGVVRISMTTYSQLFRSGDDDADGDTVPLQQYAADTSYGRHRDSLPSVARRPGTSRAGSGYASDSIPSMTPNLQGGDFSNLSHFTPAYTGVEYSGVPETFFETPAQRSVPAFANRPFDATRRYSSRSLLPPTSEVHIPNLDRRFSRAKQLRSILVEGTFKWLITVGLIGVLGVTIDYFKSKPVLNNTEKRYFDAWSTGISIALGLNIASALKDMALNLRWLALSRRTRRLREVDLYLQCDSLSTLIKIAYTTRRLTAFLVCVIVLLWNLVAQIGVAAIGLTYSTDSTSARAILVPNAQIWIPDLSAFSTPTDSTPSEFVQWAMANALGVTSTNYKWCYANNQTCGLPSGNETYASVASDFWLDGSTWRYVFLDTPPLAGNSYSDPGGRSDISIYSERNLETNATCTPYEMTVNSNGQWEFKSNGSVINTYPPYLTLSTSFMANLDSDALRDKCVSQYGNRTAYVEAFETGNTNSDNGALAPYWYYSCCVSVSEIHNASDNKPQMSANMSWTAAAAIALQGYHDFNFTPQYQIYQRETYWGTPMAGNADQMSMLMAQFAVGTFVAQGYQGPMNSTIGTQPVRGSVLVLEQYALMLLSMALIGGLHLACLLLSAFMVRNVVIPANTPLSMARKLGPLVYPLGGRGSLLDGKEIATALNRNVLYGVVEEKGEGYRTVFADVAPVTKFPEGQYV